MLVLFTSKCAMLKDRNFWGTPPPPPFPPNALVISKRFRCENQEDGPSNGSKIGIYMEKTPKGAPNGRVFGESCRGDKQQVGVVVKVTTK